SLQGQLQRDDVVRLAEHQVPQLALQNVASDPLWRVEVRREGEVVRFSWMEVLHLFEQLQQTQTAPYTPPKQRASFLQGAKAGDLSVYRPIAEDLPELYRVGRFQPGEREPESVRAFSRQLADYLSFFDEVLKSYLHTIRH
ncbi:hypothetical protein RZS08_35385, partial [Arthrospira platensis SPKY1]|nr:hypothetical protein [Arthrospira platensis SPKY1]